MPRNTIISIYGTGNVATHLAQALVAEGYNLEHIYGRNVEKSKALANKIGAEVPESFADFAQSSTVVIVAIKDDALREIEHILPKINALVVHTSGFGSSTILSAISERYGVFYPIQSFSLSSEVNWKNVPILIESNLPEDLNLLKSIAENISERPVLSNEEARRTAHLAAVFANNFSNILFEVADDLLKTKGYSLNMLQPLISLTASRTKFGSPIKFQTGPASRRDYGTLDKHRALLQDNPKYLEVYNVLSSLIEEKIYAELQRKT
ncbi:MAG: Rossmann-like and DUF2520 domain-containing protein [Luteibaculaceae bacterium]